MVEVVAYGDPPGKSAFDQGRSSADEWIHHEVAGSGESDDSRSREFWPKSCGIPIELVGTARTARTKRRRRTARRGLDKLARGVRVHPVLSQLGTLCLIIVQFGQKVQ